MSETPVIHCNMCHRVNVKASYVGKIRCGCGSRVELCRDCVDVCADVFGSVGKAVSAMAKIHIAVSKRMNDLVDEGAFDEVFSAGEIAPEDLPN